MTTTASTEFSPGALVRARGREWVVQPGSDQDFLRLRPLGGSEDDITSLIPELETAPPEAAIFPEPDPTRRGAHTAALLLRDALQLKLRAGAGPFRSFGNIAIEPRAYQLVPLLMALRQPTVRLLIADDVGIGKTIEAGLIVRELFDRGEIRRMAVLCPPHLVDQWQGELSRHFHLKAVALTASSVSRLERNLPPGVSLFQQHPFVVVSLDYIKSERHRDHFLSIAPECIVVDEAHTCSTGGQGKQLRFELLQRLAQDEERHLLMLTATPHSGDDRAFHNLLSLLRPDFAALADGSEATRRRLREDLASYFVQRRRKDIEEWQDTSVFPRRFTAEITYELSGAWGDFFDAVQAYCLNLALEAEKQEGQTKHMIWYATLALLRCVASSPAAAVRALTTRLEGDDDSETAALADEERILDGQGDDLTLNDLEPAAALNEAGALRNLITQAHALAGTEGDPKLKSLFQHLQELLKDGFRPVIFCRYIATAHYVAEHLRKALKKATVEAITGEYTPAEREERVEALIEADTPVLVATDCLSEGINLQHGFTAVVHYDLAWNPTRHEQREGRVDRFGQRGRIDKNGESSNEVRCTMLYGQDNPIDGFIFNVILKKAEAIRRDLGVLVPLPQDEQRIQHAVVKAALLKRSRRAPTTEQLLFDLEEAVPDLRPLQTEWNDALERAKANRTIFAQRRLRPEEVLPEWRRQVDLIGEVNSIERFVQHACARLNAPLEPDSKSAVRFLPQHLPEPVKERLAEEQLNRPLAIDFHYPPATGAHFIHRTHPLVSILADTVLESALDGQSALAARCAATVTDQVAVVTAVFLLRLRHQLTYRKRGDTRTLMAEETLAIAAVGRRDPQWLQSEEVSRLLEVTPRANLDDASAEREIRQALALLRENRSRLGEIATARAEALLQDHRRVREAARDLGSYSVSPCLPVDVIGCYVLLPDAL
jgi:superfamily II DNA or RNA helicase